MQMREKKTKVRKNFPASQSARGMRPQEVTRGPQELTAIS